MRRHAGILPLTLARLFATLSLAAGLLFSGFAVCAFVPQTTEFLTHSFATEDKSDYSRTSLTQAALATRDFTLFSNNSQDLASQLRHIVQEQIKALDERGGSTTTPALEALRQAEDIPDLTQVTDERLGFTAEVMGHLQDVHKLIVQAEMSLGVLGVAGLASFIYLGLKRGRRGIGAIFIMAPLSLVTLLIGMAVAGALDFASFFNFLHSLVFTQGSWIFPADSLLICMYPLNFWLGMGVIWLLVSLAACLLSLVIGLKLRK